MFQVSCTRTLLTGVRCWQFIGCSIGVLRGSLGVLGIMGSMDSIGMSIWLTHGFQQGCLQLFMSIWLTHGCGYRGSSYAPFAKPSAFCVGVSCLSCRAGTTSSPGCFGIWSVWRWLAGQERLCSTGNATLRGVRRHCTAKSKMSCIPQIMLLLFTMRPTAGPAWLFANQFPLSQRCSANRGLTVARIARATAMRSVPSIISMPAGAVIGRCDWTELSD